jgi:hypothetical protein
MALRAVRDTYGYELVTPATATEDALEVRRRIVAGQQVPPHYRLEDESAVQESSGPFMGRSAYQQEQVGHPVKTEVIDGIRRKAPVKRGKRGPFPDEVQPAKTEIEMTMPEIVRANREEGHGRAAGFDAVEAAVGTSKPVKDTKTTEA